MRNCIYQRSFSMTEISLIQLGGRKCQQVMLTTGWKMGSKFGTQALQILEDKDEIVPSYY